MQSILVHTAGRGGREGRRQATLSWNLGFFARLRKSWTHRKAIISLTISQKNVNWENLTFENCVITEAIFLS